MSHFDFWWSGRERVKILLLCYLMCVAFSCCLLCSLGSIISGFPPNAGNHKKLFLMSSSSKCLDSWALKSPISITCDVFLHLDKGPPVVNVSLNLIWTNSELLSEKPWGQENSGSRTVLGFRAEKEQNFPAALRFPRVDTATSTVMELKSSQDTIRTPSPAGCLTRLGNLIQGETWPRADCSLWLTSRRKRSSKSTTAATLLNLSSYVSNGPRC